ncbi:flap endonuclease Xni [Chromatiaceae bacterium AAb-1]|nr:flap endonuclease Xni [Chromatiaceae bacterium AAb-1]
MAHLVLIDALNLIRRLYAVQERPYQPLAEDVADGTRQQIISNTRQMLVQAIERLRQELSPTHGLLVFDGRNSQWRRQLYAGYKANRKPMPDILAAALPDLEQTVKQHNFHCWQQSQHEADDIIATLASKMAQYQQQVTIVSSDKGYLPLLSQYIHIYDPFSRQQQTPELVIQKFGVPPEQLVRLWSLTGDSTNNIPGVVGIGPKTALELMAMGNTLTEALEHPDCHKKVREKILQHKDDIKCFMQVLSLQTDLQLGINLQTIRLNGSS